MAEKTFSADAEDPEMDAAFQKARETFKYFWRELYWEYHRIVPALEVACVKVIFSQEIDGQEEVEHMWINEVEYDGERITGTLINTPEYLTNIQEGDEVDIPLEQVSDWLFAYDNKSYGGFTIQVLRSEMDDAERADHDKAWGVNFGDYNEVLLVREQKEKPENLVEHPMSINSREGVADFIKENPDEMEMKDLFGNTTLISETIAGNRTVIEVLKAAGADISATNTVGKTALDYAKQLNWTHIIPLLS